MNIVYDQCSLTSSVHQALFGEKYKQLSENSLEVCHDDTTGFEPILCPYGCHIPPYLAPPNPTSVTGVGTRRPCGVSQSAIH